MKVCKKCNAVYIGDSCPFCSEKKSLTSVDVTKRLRTPSDLDIPVFLTCPPIIQKIYIENNVFMEELGEETIRKLFNPDTLISQWMNAIQVISMDALILTLPPHPLFQDLQFVNSFVYLPHVEEPTCVISNFKAEGRQPESDLVEEYLNTMGYKTYRIPDPEWFFEGEPCLKYLRDNIYIASYGERTTEEALNWIAEKFDAHVIKLGIESEVAYHGDEIFCPIAPDKVMCVIPFCRKEALKELEKHAEIIAIEDKDVGEFCITNNVPVGYTIYAGTYIELFEPDTDFWKIEMKKLDMLEDISAKYGYDLVVFDISQVYLLGGALSCWFARLNYSDRAIVEKWLEYGKK